MVTCAPLFILLCIALLLCACVKTTETVFTALSECKDLKQFDDADDMRDKYDTCMMFKDEELKTDSTCEKLCMAHCTKEEMLYEDTWIDFTGCHCYCKLKL
jgi:hypothetical protein